MNMPNPAAPPSSSPVAEIDNDALSRLRAGLLDETAQRRLLQQALARVQGAKDADARDAERVFEVGDHLAYALLSAGRFDEARDVALQALAAGEDFALLHTLALGEHALGQTRQAIVRLEQALRAMDASDAPELEAPRADMLEHMAQFQLAQNQPLRALQPLQRAAELHHELHEVDGYIRCKKQLAMLCAELGDGLQASEHWLDVLAAARAPDAAKTRADQAALALLKLADLAREADNSAMENSLREEAVATLAQAGLDNELAQTLFQIARARNRRDVMWQALWLMLGVKRNVEGLINAQAWLFMREDQKTAPEAAQLAAAVWAAIESIPADDADFDEEQQARIKRIALTHLFSCARMQGVHENEIVAWMEREGLRAEDDIIRKMLNRIESLAEMKGWLFDPRVFMG